MALMESPSVQSVDDWFSSQCTYDTFWPCTCSSLSTAREAFQWSKALLLVHTCMTTSLITRQSSSHSTGARLGSYLHYVTFNFGFRTSSHLASIMEVSLAFANQIKLCKALAGTFFVVRGPGTVLFPINLDHPTQLTSSSNNRKESHGQLAASPGCRRRPLLSECLPLANRVH